MPASVASGTIQNGYNLTINRPTGVEAGDLLLASVSSDGTGVNLSAPGGWVFIGGKNDVGRTVYSWYKIATNSEPAQYTFSSSSTNAYRVTMLRITGAPTDSPILAAGYDATNAGGTSFTVPGATGLPTGGALEVAVMTANSGSNFTFSTPSGWSSIGQATDSNAVHMPWRTVTGTSAASQSFSTTASFYSAAWGAIFIRSGQVITISRSITPTKDFFRGPFAKLFTASISIQGASTRTRVVLRLFTRVLGGTGGTDGFNDDFTDSFTSPGSANAFGSSLIKSAGKNLGGSITVVGAPVRQANKILGGSITPTGTVTRSPVRVFTASIRPARMLLTQNIGRLFGAPGIVDITVRLAGEIRARVRRR